MRRVAETSLGCTRDLHFFHENLDAWKYSSSGG